MRTNLCRRFYFWVLPGIYGIECKAVMIACEAVPGIDVNDTRLRKSIDLLKCADSGFRFFIVNARDPDVGKNVVNDVDAGQHDLNDKDEIAFFVSSDGISVFGKGKERGASLCQRLCRAIGVGDGGPRSEINDARRRQSHIALEGKHGAFGFRSVNAVGIHGRNGAVRLREQTEHGL